MMLRCATIRPDATIVCNLRKAASIQRGFVNFFEIAAMHVLLGLFFAEAR